MKKSIVLRLALFSLIVNYLHVKKDSALHFINLEYPFHKDALYKVWLNLGKWFLRRRQNVKNYRQTNGRTRGRADGRQQVILSAEKNILRKFKNWDLYRFMLISPILIFKFSLIRKAHLNIWYRLAKNFINTTSKWSFKILLIFYRWISQIRFDILNWQKH